MVRSEHRRIGVARESGEASENLAPGVLDPNREEGFARLAAP